MIIRYCRVSLDMTLPTRSILGGTLTGSARQVWHIGGVITIRIIADFRELRNLHDSEFPGEMWRAKFSLRVISLQSSTRWRSMPALGSLYIHVAACR